MGLANERRCYIVTSSLIGWAYTKKWSLEARGGLSSQLERSGIQLVIVSETYIIKGNDAPLSQKLQTSLIIVQVICFVSIDERKIEGTTLAVFE